MLEAIVTPLYQRLIIHPIVYFLRRYAWTSAKKLTMLAGCFGVLAGVCIALDFPWLAFCLLMLSGLFDSVDGSFARITHTQSNGGAALDIIMDRVVESAIILGLYAYSPTFRGWLCLGIFIANLLCITSFLIAGIFAANDSHKSFHYSHGLIERAEAFFFFAAMILWPGAFSVLSSVYILLVLFTAFYRLYQLLQQDAVHR